jgi:hypothetical protein
VVETQTALWHDTIEDALRDVVAALGGPKKVASEIWPAKPVQDAARALNHALNSERPEKLGLSEVVFILRWASREDIHIAMHWLADACGYEQPRPVTREQQQTDLQAEILRNQQAILRAMGRLERI